MFEFLEIKINDKIIISILLLEWRRFLFLLPLLGDTIKDIFFLYMAKLSLNRL